MSGLTFTVQPGRVTGLLGPNGSGKSTTMRLIPGLDLPTAGTALVGGRQYRSLSLAMTHVGALLELVASHVMSEMQLTADHLVILGAGRLIAEAPMAELVARHSTGRTLVESPDRAALLAMVRGAGGAAQADPSGGLLVIGLDAASIGELAHARRVRLHRLVPLERSLEDVDSELVAGSAEFTDADPVAARASLDRARGQGRAAVTELRTALRLLRDGAELGAPAPGLDQLDDLVRITRSAGASLMPSGAGSDGFGLIGMREPVQALGGRLTSGPCAGGGYRVTAQLPTREPRPPAVPEATNVVAS